MKKEIFIVNMPSFIQFSLMLSETSTHLTTLLTPFLAICFFWFQLHSGTLYYFFKQYYSVNCVNGGRKPEWEQKSHTIHTCEVASI